MSETVEYPECICGAGNMFYAHLHTPDCPCSTSELLAAPPSKLDTLREQLEEERRTHATALSTVQALHREAVQDKEQVTRELEEAKKPVPCGVCCGSPLKSGRQCICGGVGTEQAEMHGLRVECFNLREQLATARRDALREVMERVEKLPRYSPHVPEAERFCFDMIQTNDGAYLLRAEALSALGGDA